MIPPSPAVCVAGGEWLLVLPTFQLSIHYLRPSPKVWKERSDIAAAAAASPVYVTRWQENEDCILS